ncbi:MAG: response regulator, partial [Hymenobacter sp.]
LVPQPFHSWEDYRAAQAISWGLRAWQQHAARPTTSRRLLDQATALLGGGPVAPWQAYRRRQLAGYCLAMHEPAYALRLLRPLVPLYQRPLSVLSLSQVTELLTQAYAGAGRYDSAYHYARRTQALTDSLRAGRQFAALAAAEARYRTREQASQIQLLTARSQQQAQRLAAAAGGVAVFGLALLAVGLAWRATRRLNQQLAIQKRQLEAQAQHLGELDAAKDQFFANVSHELRTPLTLVLGPLQQALAPQPAAARRELLATGLRHAQHLRLLIDRILDLTKLEAGKLPVQQYPTPLAALLAELVAQFRPLAAAGNLLLLPPLDVPATLTLLLDVEKLSQILTNLLANAIHYTPAGGQVRLAFAQPGPDWYALTVQDTGPGIAEAEQARLFERFYQSPQRQARGGTGLGLALSRELAQLLGGQLTLTSQLGQGAAFTFTFPAQPAPAAAPAEAPPAPPPRLPAPAALAPRARLLLVEDHAEMRAYLRSLLAPHYEVLEAEDGQQALAVLARETVDLVASDAMMPHLSGLDLLYALKADPNWQGVPFLMVTARADEAHRLAALTVGVDDYLTKPFEAAELLVRVSTLLARQQTRLHFASLTPADVAEPAAAPFLSELADEAPELTAADQLARWQAQLADCLADQAFGPDELAAHLLLSRRTLYRRLGELAGLTPAAWLRELRLDKARRLLEAGGFGSVTQVAESTGFANPKYFSTLYTERFGRRPSDYAK